MCTVHDGIPELARLSRLRKSQIKGLLVPPARAPASCVLARANSGSKASTLEPTNMGQGNQCLIACGGSKTVSVTVQRPPAFCPCGVAGGFCLDFYSSSADDSRGFAVPFFVCVYVFVADRPRRPAVAVAISADVLTADPACRIAVLISVGVYGTT